jgi:hypothetical protein
MVESAAAVVAHRVAGLLTVGMGSTERNSSASKYRLVIFIYHNPNIVKDIMGFFKKFSRAHLYSKQKQFIYITLIK